MKCLGSHLQAVRFDAFMNRYVALAGNYYTPPGGSLTPNVIVPKQSIRDATERTARDKQSYNLA